MALIVQKYGGTSVGSIERIRNVAERVAKFKMLGHQVVVVVSAMSGETNRLIALANQIQKEPDPREMDVLVSTGEQVTIALLAMALHDLGLKGKSYTGSQVRIVTDSEHTKARILAIEEEDHRRELLLGCQTPVRAECLAQLPTEMLARFDALVDACRNRARPIVMTALAMGAGMLPVALGIGVDPSFRAPMAIAVIGGLVTSTLLSLLVVPAVYTYIDDFEALLGRFAGRLGWAGRDVRTPKRQGASGEA